MQAPWIAQLVLNLSHPLAYAPHHVAGALISNRSQVHILKWCPPSHIWCCWLFLPSVCCCHSQFNVIQCKQLPEHLVGHPCKVQRSNMHFEELPLLSPWSPTKLVRIHFSISHMRFAWKVIWLEALRVYSKNQATGLLVCLLAMSLLCSVSAAICGYLNFQFPWLLAAQRARQ